MLPLALLAALPALSSPAQGAAPAAAVPLRPPAGPPAHECGTEVRREDHAVLLAGGAGAGGGAEDDGAALGGLPSPTWIGVVVHVVRRGDGTGGMDPVRTCAALAVLDAAYASTDLRFFLAAPVDFVDDDVYFDQIDTGAEANALRQVNNDPLSIDVYVVEALASTSGPLCGSSTFPNATFRGVLIDSECFPPLNDSTLPHEIGHHLNLLHTWDPTFGVELVDGSNCGFAGDLVCDTPADPFLTPATVTPPPGCVYTGGALDPNGDAYAPDTRNYMASGQRACRDSFTAGQSARMRNALAAFMPELVNAAPRVPVADCDGDGVRDDCATGVGLVPDANGDGVPDACTGLAQTYCDALPNSTGVAAVIAWSGSLSVAADDLVLSAGPIPPGNNGLFIQSLTQGDTLLGDGRLCLSTAPLGFILRLPFEQSDGGGTMTHALDIAHPRDPFGTILPGTTWYFQAWYRDPQNLGGAGFNFSDGLCVLFAP